MTVHPEERRIAGLLRELVVQSGVALETLEKSLGWKPGRLLDLIEGRLRLSIEDILEVLPLLSTTPTDFFAWLYGFDARSPLDGQGRETAAEASGNGVPGQQTMDRRFDQSLRVVRDALTRRRAWKEERSRS
jgi:hypothetical protein